MASTLAAAAGGAGRLFDDQLAKLWHLPARIRRSNRPRAAPSFSRGMQHSLHTLPNVIGNHQPEAYPDRPCGHCGGGIR